MRYTLVPAFVSHCSKFDEPFEPGFPKMPMFRRAQPGVASPFGVLPASTSRIGPLPADPPPVATELDPPLVHCPKLPAEPPPPFGRPAFSLPEVLQPASPNATAKCATEIRDFEVGAGRCFI